MSWFISAENLLQKKINSLFLWERPLLIPMWTIVLEYFSWVRTTLPSFASDFPQFWARTLEKLKSGREASLGWGGCTAWKENTPAAPETSLCSREGNWSASNEPKPLGIHNWTAFVTEATLLLIWVRKHLPCLSLLKFQSTQSGIHLLASPL